MKKSFPFLILVPLLILSILLIYLLRDRTPPVVSIENIKNNQTVSGVVTIKAQVSDNRGVGKVEFYVNSEKMGEVKGMPYEFKWVTIKNCRWYIFFMYSSL